MTTTLQNRQGNERHEMGAQTARCAVSPASKPVSGARVKTRFDVPRPDALEIDDPAGLEKCAPSLSHPGLRPKLSLVDDDKGLHLFLEELGKLGHFNLISSFYNAAEALDRLPEERPDAVIMDVRLPDISGIDCTNKFKTILPDLPIIILTGFPDGRNFFRALMEGAQGFLVKPITAQEFLTAIDDVLKGKFAFSNQVVPFLIQIVQQVRQVAEGHCLTAREEEVLACLFEGMQDKEIASTLGIGTATVHTHMHRLFEKLRVHSRKDIIAKYLALS